MRWIALSLIAVLVASCGQKGPLTLPEAPRAMSDLAPATIKSR